jgi:hypothetical protein
MGSYCSCSNKDNIDEYVKDNHKPNMQANKDDYEVSKLEYPV